MGKVIRPFCWHQNLVPWGLSVPAPGLYTCIKSWKFFYKIRLQRHLFKLATNEWSDKTFLLTSKLCPLGAVCPCPCPYLVKTLKNLLLRNQQADDLETWYAASGAKVLQACSNDDPGMTLTILQQGQIWSPLLLYGKKVKQSIFLQKLLSSMIWN